MNYIFIFVKYWWIAEKMLEFVRSKKTWYRLCFWNHMESMIPAILHELLISALFERFYDGDPWENIFWNLHKRPKHLTQK